MIKPLLRTIPTLSGNVKLACTLLDYIKDPNNIDGCPVYNTHIRGAHIYPLSSQLFQKGIEAHLLNSSWEHDIKTFFNYYEDTFYDAVFQVQQTEVPLLDKTSTQYSRNTDFEYGVKRISYSKSGNQFACFAPIYIDDYVDIPSYFLLRCTFKDGKQSTTKYIRINIASTETSDNKYKDKNYICKYLVNYLRKIDSNVAYIDNVTKNVVYHGIDAVHGGFMTKVDSTISTLFSTKIPIQLFDYTISEGFKRNNMIMKQCLPLCFYFNVDDILTPREKPKYILSDIEFSGNYYDKNGVKLDWYDFSCDYDTFSQDIIRMDLETGIMKPVSGFISNIMDVGFPALCDKWLTNYRFANKLSKTFNRWKLKYSSDEHPYITNMSWQFSKNQDNNYKYREFPSRYSNQSGYADVDINFNYNLLFPLGKDKTYYDRLNPRSTEKYEAIMNNYCLSWFDIVSTDNINADNIESLGINWSNTEDGYSYFNNVLYNFNTLYNKIPNGTKPIDKFAFLVYPKIDRTNILTKTEYDTNVKFVKHVLSINEASHLNTVPVYGNESAGNVRDIILDPSQKDLFNIFDNETVKYYNYSTDGVFEERNSDEIEDDEKVYINLNDLTNIDNAANIVRKNYYNINTLYTVQDLDFANELLTLPEEKYSINLTADEILNCSVIEDLRNTIDWYKEFLAYPEIANKIKDYQNRLDIVNLDRRDRTDSKITILFDNIPDNINRLLGLNIVDKVYHGSVSKGYRYVFNAGKGKFIYLADVLEEVYFINTSLGDISQSEPSQTWKMIYTYKIADIDVTINETSIQSLDVTHLSETIVDTKFSHNPITYPTVERIINDLIDILGNEPNEDIQDSISKELYTLAIRVLGHNIKQHCEAIQRNTIHSLPSLFNRKQHGLELFEILPIYKGNLLYRSFIDGTISNEQLLEIDLWYSDDPNKFNPKQLKSVDAIDITNNKLSTNYGVMFCKKKHFVNLTWYKDQNLLPSIMKDFCDNDNSSDYRYSDVTKVGSKTKELYDAVVIVYNDIRNRLVNTFVSGELNEYMYHPSLIVDSKEVATGVVTRKQKHFDTSIESIEYGNLSSDIDDNVLYVHPFNIYNVSRTIDNMFMEEQLSKLPGTAYKRITVDDIVTKTRNDNGTITYSFHNAYNALYHIAFTTIDESLTFDNLINAKKDWKCSPKIIYKDKTYEVKEVNGKLYQSDNLTIEQYVKCVYTNLQQSDFTKPNGVIDSVEDFERRLVESNIINRINELIDEQNGIVDNYCFTEFSVTPLKAVLNDINTINLMMSFNNTPFMDIPTIENGVINLQKLHTIEQKFYKQYKAIDTLGNIYYKYVLITSNEELTIKYDNSIGMFYTIKREEITNDAGTLETIETKDIFNIVLETEFIKLNKNLWERYMNMKNQDSEETKEFRDMYIFRPLTEMEYDDKFSNSSIGIVNSTTNTANITITSDTGILYPCFKSVYYEKSKETIIYKNWVSSNIVEIKLLNITNLEEIDTFYRYNVDNASLFVEIMKKDLDTVKSKYPTTANLIKTYVKKFDSNNTRQDNTSEIADTNLLKYNLKTVDVGDTRYGYYIVTVDLNNSRDMFNIRGIVDNDTLNLSSVDFMPKLKYITYINGVDITKSPEYLQSIFRQLCPFLNIDLLGEATKLETMMIPKAFTLTDVYETVKVSPNDSIKERNLVFNKQNIGTTKTSVLQRYTNSIVPFIHKANTIENLYDYKYKDVQTQILPSGNYYSIGDFTIKSSRSTIDLPVPLSVYHSYQGKPDTYYPVEYKYFNKSKMVNLETEIKIPVTRNLTYDELLQYESDAKTLEVFASHINKKKAYSGDELLFLYKKYKVSFDSTSVKLKLDKSEKLYKLTYIFTLL